jgi:Flp pilus assembly protein TadG
MKNVASAHNASGRTSVRRWRALAGDCRGASAVEFAIIVALLFAVVLGGIEFSVATSQWVEAEKATQMGVRMAAVSDPVAAGLRSATCLSGIADPGMACSEPAASATGTFQVICTASTATLGGAGACTNRPAAWPVTGCDGNGFCPAAHDAIVARMQTVLPRIGRQNVEIEYRDDFGAARLGYSGRPTGPVPLVTVRLRNMQYQFMVLGPVLDLLGDAVAASLMTMPSFAATLTGEDLKSVGS